MKNKTGVVIFGFAFLVMSIMLSLLFFALTKEIPFSIASALFLTGFLSFFLLLGDK